MLDPWAPRPPATKGDLDPDLLFSQIGQALTEWAHVETACAEIYAVLVQAPRRRPFESPALRAYGSLPSISTQSQLIRYAGKAFFHTRPRKRPLQKPLEKLLDRLGDYGARRNEIAHGYVAQVFLQKSKQAKGLQNVGYFLLPVLSATKKFDLQKGEIEYQYRSGDVIHYRQEFTKFCMKLAAMRDQLRG